MSAREARQRAIEWLEAQIAQLGELNNASPRDNRFKEWRQTTLTTFQRIWPGEPARADRFRRIRFTAPYARPDDYEMRDFFQRGAAEATQLLRAALAEVTGKGVPDSSDVETGSAFQPGSQEDDFPTLDLPAADIEAAKGSPREMPAIERVPLGDYSAMANAPPAEPPAPLELDEETPPGLRRPTAEAPPAAQRPTAEAPPKRPTAEAPPAARRPNAEGPAVLPPARRPAEAPPPPARRPAAEAPVARESNSQSQAGRARPAGKSGKAPKKLASRLRDMLGLPEDRAVERAPVPEEATPQESAAPPAELTEPAMIEEPPAPPRAATPRASEEEPVEARAEEAFVEEAPVEEEAPEPDRSAEADEFLSNSPVFQSHPKPVRRRRISASFQTPVAIALAALAEDLDAVQVPEEDQTRVRAELTTLARHFEARDLDWARLRAAIEFVLEFPGLTRRVLPMLLPHLEQAA